MKLIFFVVAFCLVSIRVYFSWLGNSRARSGESTANMVISSDNFREEISYSGKFVLTDDETAFKSISPGGYLKFRKNEEWVKAESNLKGEIEYNLYDGKNKLTTDEQGKKLIAAAIKEMVAWGFDASNRMERIYRKGGSRALLNEVDSVKSDVLKMQYLDRVIGIDSLCLEDQRALAKKIASLGSDMDKRRFLNKFSLVQLQDSQINQTYFNAVAGMGSDLDKADALRHIIDLDSLLSENTDKIIAIVRGMGSDMDKAGLFKSLMQEKNLTEAQWISLINETAQLGSDMDKSFLLTEIAQKMPKTEAVKTAYLAAAKTISNDQDYGKAVRAVE